MSSQEEQKKPEESTELDLAAEVEDLELAGEEDGEDVVYLDEAAAEEIFLEGSAEEGEEDEEQGELEAEEEDDQIDDTPVAESWKTFTSHTDSVFTTTLFKNPVDGHVLLATGGCDDLAYLFDLSDASSVPSGEYKLKFEGHTDSVISTQFSSDGKLLATAGMDAVLKIWKTADGSLLHTLDGPSESIESIFWHQKGPVILAACGDGTIWMWDASANSGSNLNVFGGHAGRVSAAKFTPDGSKIVSVGEDGTCRVWGPKTGKTLQTIKGHGFHEAGINCLQISTDSTLILTGGEDNLACISNVSTGKVKSTLQGHNDSVEEVAWVIGQPWVVTGSLDGRVGIWDLNTGNNRQFIENGYAGITSVQCIENTIFTSDTGGYLRLWDVRSATKIQEIRAHLKPILGFDVNVEHSLIASASDDFSVKLFKLQP